MTTRIGITGAAGRMGRTLIEAIGLAGDELQLTAAIEQPDSSLLGADAGELAGQGKNGVTVVGALAEVIGDIDVLIDFTVPAGDPGQCRAMCRKRCGDSDRHHRALLLNSRLTSRPQAAKPRSARHQISAPV